MLTCSLTKNSFSIFRSFSLYLINQYTNNIHKYSINTKLLQNILKHVKLGYIDIKINKYIYMLVERVLERLQTCIRDLQIVRLNIIHTRLSISSILREVQYYYNLQFLTIIRYRYKRVIHIEQTTQQQCHYVKY